MVLTAQTVSSNYSACLGLGKGGAVLQKCTDGSGNQRVSVEHTGNGWHQVGHGCDSRPLKVVLACQRVVWEMQSVTC